MVNHRAWIGPAPLGGLLLWGRIADGRLTLEPVLSAAAIRAALAHPLRFSQAGWMVAVAFPGHTWKRVPCRGWC